MPVFKKIIAFLPVILVMIIVNFIIDPANLRMRDRTERWLVDALVRGQNIANVTDQNGYNERPLQIYYAQRLAKIGRKIGALVLGSSRGMTISLPSTTDDIFYNASVNGANIIDFINISNIFFYYKQIPKRVIISLDPLPPNKDISLTVATWRLTKEMDLGDPGVNRTIDLNFAPITSGVSANSTIQRYLNFLSPEYFQTSVFMEVRQLAGKGLVVTDKSDLDTRIKMSNGSIKYDEKTETATTAIYLGDVETVVQKDAGGCPPNEVLDGKIVSWIQTMRENNIQVIFFLAPFSPRIFSQSNPNYFGANLWLSEKYYRELARENNISVYGSYDPAVYNLNQNDFIDLVHPKMWVVREILTDVR